jgi:prolyl-tRNA editing enzyme YbaK/EbsC (Cys-tRNA(Pro) deacylase)
VVIKLSIDKVKLYLQQFNRENDVLEFASSSATVELAAGALNVIPARIAKTIALKHDDGCILIVAAGDAKIDNIKFRAEYRVKTKMLSHDDVVRLVGHSVGGVCPFAINDGVPVYLDISLKRFESVFPACGSANSAIELTCSELYEYSQAQGWVDVCKVTLR